MRFIENGPSIPDELLLARDEGRVVFFCGAGVSRAEAGLPDFYGLAERVIEALGVVSDSPVRTVFNHAKETEKATGVPGLISADRLFGLMEREFDRSDIENAVAQELKPVNPEKLSAHQALIDLATTPTGLVRIVTTNFDRLFNDCNAELTSWLAPRLPDPNRPKEFDGVVYLHGRVTDDYSSSEDDGFILSSGEFGRAYLAQAWATQFFKSILSKYVVVFVGYTADDPPVHYLLEALSKDNGHLENIYAFQSGDQENARAKWQHKGVEAIAYDEVDYHKALWDTLKLWAERAKDTEAWYQTILERAEQGPRELLPHERGQVTHVVSSVEGMRRFKSFEPVLSAEWLLVFDKHCRYARPTRSGFLLEKGTDIDPFELYSIDSDSVPEKVSSDDYTAKRETPAKAWDAFEHNEIDRLESQSHQLAPLRGWNASKPAVLCPRLHDITDWIGKISKDPVALWWAMRQSELHSSVLDNIQWHIGRGDLKETKEMEIAWRYLVEAKNQITDPHNGAWYSLSDRIKLHGWSRNTVREYLECLRPRLRISDHYSFAPVLDSADINPRGICRPELYYPDPETSIEIDEQWLKHVVEGIRKHLESAIEIEQEFNGYGFSNLSTLTPEQDEKTYIDSDAAGYVIRYAKLFERLLQVDLESACKEYSAWSIDSFGVFELLKAWVIRNAEIADSSDLEQVFINELSTQYFWASSHSRDIVLTLEARWQDFNADALVKLEKRILDGPDMWSPEEEGYQERRSWRVLDRVQWLIDHDCKLEVDVDQLQKKLIGIVPKWKPESSHEETQTTRSRGGIVRTETNYAELVNLPLGKVLKRAEELRGRTEDFLVEAEPFKGFVDDYPTKAAICLNSAAFRKEPADWAWHIFLRAEGRKNDGLLFINWLAHRLNQYSDEIWVPLVRDVANWINDVSDKLLQNRPATFYLVIDRLISSAVNKPELFGTSISNTSKNSDLVMQAINSPLSPIIQAMFGDPRLENLNEGDSLPADWLNRIQTLLEMGNSVSSLAVVICNRNLNWFYHWATQWTSENLLKYQTSDLEWEVDAFWSGFFWRGKVPTPELFRILKEPLVAFAKDGKCSRHGYGNVLAWMLLAGWGNIDETTKSSYIASSELREILVKADDEFRVATLRQIQRWSDETESGKQWQEKVETFLTDVWPKQITAKSPATTLSLCGLVFSNENIFSRTGRTVLPLLVQVEATHISLTGLRKSEGIVTKYPSQVLDILYKVLSDDVRNWPHDIGSTFSTIETAEPDLKFDERLIELKRKWDSR